MVAIDSNMVQSVGNILIGLAWPTVVLIIIYMAKDKLRPLIERLISFKFKDFALTFSEISKELISEETPEQKKSELRQHQVVHQNPHYRLYSNGILVQRYEISLFPGDSRRTLSYNIAFPNEALSVQVVGDVSLTITKIEQGYFEFIQPEIQNEKRITLIIHGV